MDNERLSSQQPTRDIRFEKPTFIDPLTGLFNRYYLYEFLPQEVKKAQASNYSLGIFILDIDNFKDLNDKYGHLTGDIILKQFSEFLKKTRRQTDMVIRYAGDEFMVLLPGVDYKTGLMLGERLLEQIERASFRGKNNEELRLTVSIGFSLCPSDATDVDQLIDLADKALYLSKEKGRNRVSHAQEVTLETAAFKIAMDKFPCPKFVDRYDEMTRLKQLFNDTVLGKGVLEAVFVSAERGAGRSRILFEFNNYAKDKATILNGKGSFKHKDDPYYLLVSCLDDYISKIGVNSFQAREIFSAVPAEELTELSKLFPQIKTISDFSSSDKESRSLLFKAFMDLLININKNAALVFSFDDIQWADKASLELLHYIIQYENKRKMFMLLSFYESTPLDRKPAPAQEKEGSRIRRLLNYLGDAENVIEIKLPNLSLRDTYEMIEDMFPGLRELKEFNHIVFNITKGNPAFIEEIFKALVENRLLVYKDKAWRLGRELKSTDIPNSVEETIKRRLKTLDKETKEVIVQAAVIGDDFSVDLLKQIGEKNEGYIFELMARARKMHLVKESDKKGTFNFISKEIQNALYNELDEPERLALHKKIGHTLEEEHKDDLDDIAADLSFHFGKIPQSAATAKYTSLIQQKADNLFNPAEIIDYLNELSQEVIAPAEEEEKVVLTPTASLEINRLIQVFMSAVKNFQLYPAGSSIRTSFVKDMHQSLGLILDETQKLHIIESEGTLVINGKRYSTRETQRLGGEDFISLLVEGDIKSVSFMPGITEEEITAFVENLSQGRSGITEKGGWKNIIQQEKLVHIKIGEFSYEQVTKAGLGRKSGRRRFEDAMIMEFLLGKVDPDTVQKRALLAKISSEPEKFAQAITDMAQQDTTKKGKSQEQLKSITEGIKKINTELSKDKSTEIDAAAELSKVILELDWRLKNKFIRSRPEIIGADKQNITKKIIAKLPDEEILKLIENSYTHGLTNPLAVKDLIDKSLPTSEKRQKVSPKISTKLSQLGVNKEMTDYLVGNTGWEKLPLEKRLEAFIKLPQTELQLVDVDLLAGLLEELLNKGKTQDIQNLLQSLISKASGSKPDIRQKIDRAISDFVKADSNIADRVYPLSEILRTETRNGVYVYVLNIIKDILEEHINNLGPQDISSKSQQPIIKAYNRVIIEIFDILAKRMKSKDTQDMYIQGAIKDFISAMLNFSNFLNILIFALLDYFRTSPGRIKEILQFLGEEAVGALVNICLSQEKLTKDSFEGYAERKRVASVLQQMGDSALNKIKQNLSGELPEEDLFIILELAGNLGREELMDSLEPFLYHPNLELRKQAIQALSTIGTEKSNDILSSIARFEKNSHIRLFAQRILDSKKAK